MLTRKEIVECARGWIGTPYMHQQAVKGSGCDCLGLLRGMYAQLIGGPAIVPPPYSPNWNDQGTAETMLEAARRYLVEVQTRKLGTVIIVRLIRGKTAKHCAIISAIPNDMIIHAMSRQKTLETYMPIAWKKMCAGLFDFPGVEEN